MIHLLRGASQLAAPSTESRLSYVRTLLIDACWIVLAIGVIPNLLVLCLFGNSAGFFRGWLNVEITFAFLLLLTIRPAGIALGLLAVELVADLVEPLAHVFYFGSSDAVEALRFVGVIPAMRLVLYATALVAYICLTLFAFRLLAKRIEHRGASAWLILAILSVTIFSQLIDGRYSLVFHNDGRSGHGLLIRTPLSSIASPFYRRDKFLRKPQHIDSCFEHLLPSQGAKIVKARMNVVTILVESWGLFKDPQLRSSLTAPLTTPEIAARYSIDIGSVPFVGSTILGESRTLCGEIFGRPMEEVSATRLGQCYSAQFARQGYSTLAINGISPHMYNRDRWMSKVGFQQELFAPQLTKMGLRTCGGGLPGTCDDDVADLIHARLLHPPDSKPQLIHWISLSSHLPVDVTPKAVQQAHCNDSPGLDDDTVCVWYSLVYKANADIANIVLDRAIAPTVYIVAGDHAPPFYSMSRRGRFSQAEVPFVILVPRH